jgi:hypothetical protein
MWKLEKYQFLKWNAPALGTGADLPGGQQLPTLKR